MKFFFAPEIVLIISGPADQLATIYFEYARGQLLQKCPIVRDKNYAARVPINDIFQPPDGGQIKMVRRFIKHLVPVTIIDDDVVGKDNEEGSRFSRTPTLQPQRGFGS